MGKGGGIRRDRRQGGGGRVSKGGGIRRDRRQGGGESWQGRGNKEGQEAGRRGELAREGE